MKLHIPSYMYVTIKAVEVAFITTALILIKDCLSTRKTQPTLCGQVPWLQLCVWLVWLGGGSVVGRDKQGRLTVK